MDYGAKKDMQMISFSAYSDKADTVYQNCGLSFHSIAVRVGRDTMTVSRVLNQWVQEDDTERRAGFQRPPITSSREEWHATRMALMDRAATSRALNQEFGSFAKQQVFA
ncbi:HTH_Tnp_Tc3_2 domain-containing protein [Trichonephila clavipes]|nr:HTH_Tnp_Tc3_2 domain-containing protein [Trichonephila clavipes]